LKDTGIVPAGSTEVSRKKVEKRLNSGQLENGVEKNKSNNEDNPKKEE